MKVKKPDLKNPSKKAIFVPPQQLRSNPFKTGPGGAPKFNPGTFKTQHKG